MMYFFSNDTTALLMGFSLNSYTRMILLIFTRMHATLHYVGWLVSHFPLFVSPSVSNTIKFWTIQSVLRQRKNKARYTATLVACGWAGAVLEKVTRASGQELYAQKAQKRRKSKKGTDQPTDRPT